ncbi:MAG: acyl-CoA dehydrogenase family protein [Bdellovibrionota bacterium]
MDMSFTKEHEAFRREVREWIEKAMPPAMKQKAENGAHFEHHESMEWHKTLYKKGWVAPHWPKEHGGTGWDVTQRHIFNEELASAGAPSLSPFGLSMVAMVIMQFGTDEQKKRYLPKILSGEEVWCQGYSEPNAGSDLASLQLRAESDGDYYVLNGQKTWTTNGQYADWIFVLCRTNSSGKKQDGISFVLVDIKKTPGVEVRPFMNISGQTAFSETFFTNARVPKVNRVGPEHGGWTIAKALLGHERTGIAAVPVSARVIQNAKRIGRETKVGGKRLLDESTFRRKLAALEIRHRSLDMTNLRALADAQAGRAPGPESSILKIRGSEVLQEAYEFAMEAMGHNALGWFDDPPEALPASQQWIASTFNYYRAATIYGGSNEIQRNIISKMILGLPDGAKG